MTTGTDPTEPGPPSCPRHGPIAAGAPEGGLCPRCLLSVMEEEPAPASLPTRFGHYVILELLGEGGMGVVHKAREPTIGRIVALKRIRDGELASADARRRFLAEARAAADMHHPHVVPILDVGEHEGQLYFTMPYMSGGRLREEAARFAEPSAAAELVATLARAVHEGHRKRVIHRDLKPENILFDDHGEARVADFGVAKWLDGDTRTSTGKRVGTIGYMAPEQVEGRHVEEAADVWALGVILYELVAGRRPFAAPTPLEELRRTLEDEPEPLTRGRRGVDRDLWTVCLTCLQKEPSHRYASAEALVEDLRRYASNEPIVRRRPGPFERARRWCARSPVAAALLGSAALALIALTAWALAGARAQERARRAEVLATNVYAASAVAGTVLHQLDAYAGWVAREARDPALAAALARGDGPALQALCEAIHARRTAIAWWFVADAAGRLRAYAPDDERAHVRVTAAPLDGSHDMDFSFRDYFHGARALPADADRAAYVSRAFRATTDQRYKLAISAPLRGEGGAFAGVLVAMIATDRRLGTLELSDARRIAVLAVRRDREHAGEPMPDEDILLVHDGVEHGEGVVVRSAALARIAARRARAGDAGSDQLHLPPADWVEPDDDYRDPLAERDPEGASGPWLAGVAAIGRTELAVIVQTRVEDATRLDRTPLRVLAAWSVGGAVLLFAGLFAALRSRTGTRS
jgi:eukaryotic-like serine/threonine-protein kinase